MDLKFDWTQGRYRVNLPWKADYRPQNNGYRTCVARLNQLRANYRETNLSSKNTIMSSWHNYEMASLNWFQTWKMVLIVISYLTMVWERDRAITKLHIAFDASVKVNRKSLSLNDCLEKGPNGIPNLFDILLKFRSNKIAIDQKDWHALRFLWFNNITKTKSRIVQYQFCKMVFGLMHSPTILTETIQQHLVCPPEGTRDGQAVVWVILCWRPNQWCT